MPTTIPLGFHIQSFTFTVANSTHNNVTTCAGKNSGYLTAASINATWRAAFTGTGAPWISSALAVGWTLVEAKTLANIGGLLYTDINTTPIVGAGPATPPSMNVALKVKKDMGISGRPYQARFFAPPSFQESVLDAAGNILSTEVTSSQAKWDVAYNYLQTNLLDPVVLHEPSTGLIPTKINAFKVQSRVGTIGRRMRR